MQAQECEILVCAMVRGRLLDLSKKHQEASGADKDRCAGANVPVSKDCQEP